MTLRRPTTMRGRSSTTLIVVVGIAVLLGLVEVVAIQKFGRRPSAPPAQSVPAAPATATAPAATTPPTEASAAQVPPLGHLDEPAGEALVGPRLRLAGWALDAGGLRAVEARIDGRAFAAQRGQPRADVARAHPAIAGSAASGFVLDVDPGPAPFGVDRRRVEVVAVAHDGRERLLGTRSLIEPGALARWSSHVAVRGEPFHLLPALSGMHLGAARGLHEQYAAYVSPTTRVGTRVPILYLRTTRGAKEDYAFDPDWDVERRCRPGSERRLSDDSLNGVFDYARKHALPVLFTLNGGIWADAACDAREWDVNDVLENDVANCQWSEKNQVAEDDYLKNLAGAFESPELARALTLNVFARDVRRYKKRNLQQAARLVAAFARDHPELFVGVNLDPDLYVNPFFGESMWFDYNPGTLRQFRDWLAGRGPYAGEGSDGAPDLSGYRRAQPLTLDEVNRLAGRAFARWEDVDPPRAFPREGPRPYWEDPWMREWETFRRHLVDLHYDELSRWLVEAGVPADRIWSSQGFMAPHPTAMPFALEVDSPVKNYDSGGMSVEGSKPAAGHLGAILYGASAQNAIRMEGPRSLFGAFAALDPRWAVVEYNSADLREPKALPTYADAYRGLREMWNHGARFVSPMAWPGSSGRDAGKPGYDPFTAWRDTPLEEAARDFLLARAQLAPGSRLWTFGASSHADDDGWTVERGRGRPRPGRLELAPDAQRAVVLVSPGELRLDPATRWRLVLLTPRDEIASVRVEGRASPQAPWSALAAAAGPVVELRPRGAGVEQLRLALTARSASAFPLARIALIPSGSAP